MRKLFALILVQLLLSACYKAEDLFPNASGAPDAEIDREADADSADTPNADPEADTDCTPECRSVECGDDGCGGQCGGRCGDEEFCAIDHTCYSEPLGDWIRVPAGPFMMGSPSDEVGREPSSDDTRESLHEVTLTHDFLMLAKEVTIYLYRAVMGDYREPFNPDCGDRCPEHGITIREAQVFCNHFSEALGLPSCYDCEQTTGRCLQDQEFDNPYSCPGFRLPTEAEWEFAARAATTTATYNGNLTHEDGYSDPSLDEIAVYGDTGIAEPACQCYGTVEDNYTCPWSEGTDYLCGPFPTDNLERSPNWLGLQDMLGNVAEFCHDSFVSDLGFDPATDPFRNAESISSRSTIRGGHWKSEVGHLRAAARASSDASTRSAVVGFRPVISLGN